MIRTLQFLLEHPLGRRHRVRTLMRFFRWQIGIRILGYPVVVPLTDRARLLVSRGMTGATGNVYCGLHEFADMAFVAHLLRPHDLFVDIGANIGAYTVLSAAIAGARGIAIEPVPTTFRHLMDNVCLNKLQQQTECYNVAIGEQQGVLRFTSTQDTTNHVIAENETASEGIEVPVTTLDSMLGERDPVCIKVDVEGFETAVVSGGERTFAKHSLQAVLMELNGSGGRYGFSEDKLHRRLQEHGFESFSYDPFTRSLSSLRSRKDAGNALYIRNVVFVEDRLKSGASITVYGDII